jgi:hypothetical protein
VVEALLLEREHLPRRVEVHLELRDPLAQVESLGPKAVPRLFRFGPEQAREPAALASRRSSAAPDARLALPISIVSFNPAE